MLIVQLLSFVALVAAIPNPNPPTDLVDLGFINSNNDDKSVFDHSIDGSIHDDSENEIDNDHSFNDSCSAYPNKPNALTCAGPENITPLDTLATANCVEGKANNHFDLIMLNIRADIQKSVPPRGNLEGSDHVASYCCETWISSVSYFDARFKKFIN